MAEVVLDSVTKVYPGGVKAVDCMDLEIRDEEFIVLVGPSGCGKSTTLRMVAGLEEITSGTIRIGDRVVNDVPPKNRDIAMVFQNYALYPHMSVYKNMAFGLKLRGYPKREIDERVRRAAQQLGIQELLERKPKALSGGQRQRVAVGRAIVRQPKAFLFDEPLSNLDAKLRVTTRAELKKLHRELRTTTIYVTHDQEEAMTLGDRIVVMKDGLVQQVATPLEVYEAPVNRFVAGFVGTPPINFFEGRIVGENGKLFFDEGSFRLQLLDSQAARMGDRVNQPVILGARPECMSDQATGRWAGQGNSIPAKVSVIEPLGDKMDIYASTSRTGHIVARVDAHTGLGEGAQVPLYLDMRKVHVFEPGDNGVNLSLRGALASATA